MGSLPFTTKSRTIHGVVFIRDGEALSESEKARVCIWLPHFIQFRSC